MGYCWSSGKKINGRWKFIKCSGNASCGPGACYPESTKDHPRCRDCIEWRKTWSEAKRTVVEYDAVHGEHQNDQEETAK